jgi:acyl-coenzyme A synthetase/AMP-(fatty) acid ligase/acyl carrier protein
LGIGPGDRLSTASSPAGVGGVWFSLRAVLTGAAFFPLDVREEGVAGLAEWLTREEITVLGVLQIIRQLASVLTGRERFPRLRMVTFGGDTVHPTDIELCRKYFGPDCLVSVGLGSTEAGRVTHWFIGKDTAVEAPVPVGYPAEGVEVIIVGEDGRAVPPGDVGEIAVKSAYLTPGYWGRPDLTEAVLRPDPRGGAGPIYLTGDRGRLLLDGRLVHLGRKDFQVKIRGYRVEIAEVEAALLGLPSIRDAVVVAREGPSKSLQLVAYVVPTGRPAPTVTVLRSALARTLPDYMVPSAFVVLDDFPKTPAGKIDRIALPAPGRGRPDVDRPFVAPRTPVEEALTAIWTEVLGIDAVGIHDHFLDLGGHSLLAAQIVTRLAATLGVELPVRGLWEAPTVADLALVVTQARAMEADPEALDQILAELDRGRAAGLPAGGPVA